jgi:hypothetical protein
MIYNNHMNRSIISSTLATIGAATWQAQITDDATSQLQILWLNVVDDHSQIDGLLQSRWYTAVNDDEWLYTYETCKSLDEDCSPKGYVEYTTPDGNIMTINTSTSQTIWLWKICIIKEYNNVILTVKQWADILQIHFIQDTQSRQVYKKVISTTIQYIEIPNIDKCIRVHVIRQ